MRAALAAIEPSALANPSAIRVVRAPGRVNLIGEHTDYNEGFVLPAAIDLEIRIAYLPTDDRRVEMTLEATGECGGFDLDSIPPRRGSWIDYVAGTAWALQAAGAATHGFRGLLKSNLPQSAGLSSSAALELASAWALAGDRAPELDGVSLARAAQRGENEYVGVLCGVMDQYASANGRPGLALLLDCRSLVSRAVPLTGDASLVVCHTGSPRRLGGSEYNTRRAECERAVATIARYAPEVRALRDVDGELLDSYRERIDPVALRRAEHVVTENARVLAVGEALQSGDLAAVGRLFAESHASLRDRYEVGSQELDALVEIASATPGVIAARMTGAGFGGCTVNLVRPDAVAALGIALELEYPRRTGMTPQLWEVGLAGGAGVALQ